MMSEELLDQELNIKAIIKFGLGLSALLLVSGASVWVLSLQLRAMERAKDPDPRGLQTQQYSPPAPRLQTDPLEDITVLRLRETEQLSTYGWSDRESGFARIPIERALEIAVVEEPVGEQE